MTDRGSGEVHAVDATLFPVARLLDGVEVVIFIMLATASSANNVPSRTADDDAVVPFDAALALADKRRRRGGAV